MAQGIEKREHARIPVTLSGFYESTSKIGVRLTNRLTTRNISRGGLFVESDVLLEEGVFVELELRLSSEEQSVSVTGLVCWRKETEPTGMGIQVIRTSSEDQERLDHFLERLEKEIQAG